MKVCLDAHLALQIGRSIEQLFEQDDILLIFVRLLRMAGDGPGDERDFLRLVRGEADQRAEAERQQQDKPEQRGLATAHAFPAGLRHRFASFGFSFSNFGLMTTAQ